jgi:hypothetical protein
MPIKIRVGNPEREGTFHFNACARLIDMACSTYRSTVVLIVAIGGEVSVGVGIGCTIVCKCTGAMGYTRGEGYVARRRSKGSWKGEYGSGAS